MSADHDELFQLMLGRTTTKAVERILAAGYRRPRTITTVEELDALEDPETVLVDFKHNAYQWGIGLDGSEGWQSTRDPNPITSNHLWRFAPITVLHEPEPLP